MIVKDEEFFLRQCLASAAPYVDEIIVVDTGSSDSTREIARDFTDKVFSFTWVEDFSRARNFSLSKARGDWILVLDADEVIAADDLLELREVIKHTAYDAFTLYQRQYSASQLEKGWTPVPGGEPEAKEYRGYTPNPITRVFRNREDIYYHGRIHEIVDPSLSPDRCNALDIPIHHYADENPDRSWNQRQAGYLDLMRQELEREPDGRLYSIAAATAMYTPPYDLPLAIEMLEKAVSLGYEGRKTREILAEAHYRNGDLDVAWHMYTVLEAEGYATATQCLNQANLAVKRDEIGQALDLLEKCLGLGGLGEEINAQIKQNIVHLGKRL